MGDQNKGRKICIKEETKPSFTGEVRWIRLRPESKLVLSTKNNGKQRVIYYSQNSFSSEGTNRKDFLILDRKEE